VLEGVGRPKLFSIGGLLPLGMYSAPLTRSERTVLIRWQVFKTAKLFTVACPR
jgi:hypothetical protein